MLIQSIQKSSKLRERTNEGCCSFLKTFDGKEVDLFKKLVIQFEGEEGIDVGAFTVEYVTKFFDIFRRDLFGTVESRTILIANGSAGNLILFKILGVAIEPSLLQGGLHFLIYTPDDTLSSQNYCKKKLISKEKYTELIPLRVGSAYVTSFLNVLSRTESETDVNDMSESTEGQAFEQVVNATQ